jgi:prolyl-tRNA editing enzyme YbaK/EbsC (Cys-tRNA(Pro) deacylase)
MTMNNHDPLKASAKRFQDYLHQFIPEAKVIQFQELTRTAQEAAQAIGCEVGQIAKTLIFKGKNSGDPVCIIASGINRVDERKVAALIGEPIEKPDADYVLACTGFSIGGIPPVGFQFKTVPLIDEDLMHYQEIWAAAGTPHAVVKLNMQDLLRITHGRVVDLKK